MGEAIMKIRFISGWLRLGKKQISKIMHGLGGKHAKEHDYSPAWIGVCQHHPLGRSWLEEELRLFERWPDPIKSDVWVLICFSCSFRNSWLWWWRMRRMALFSCSLFLVSCSILLASRATALLTANGSDVDRAANSTGCFNSRWRAMFVVLPTNFILVGQRSHCTSKRSQPAKCDRRQTLLRPTILLRFRYERKIPNEVFR